MTDPDTLPGTALEPEGTAPLIAPGLFVRLAVGLVLPVPTCVLLILIAGVLAGAPTENLALTAEVALTVGALLGVVPCLGYTALMERLHTLGVRLGWYLLSSAAFGLATAVLFWAPASHLVAWFPAYGAATGLLIGLVLRALAAPPGTRARVRAPW